MGAFEAFEAAAERRRQAEKAFDRAESALAVARAALNNAGREADAAWNKYMKEREAAVMAKDS